MILLSETLTIAPLSLWCILSPRISNSRMPLIRHIPRLLCSSFSFLLFFSLFFSHETNVFGIFFFCPVSVCLVSQFCQVSLRSLPNLDSINHELYKSSLLTLESQGVSETRQSGAFNTRHSEHGLIQKDAGELTDRAVKWVAVAFTVTVMVEIGLWIKMERNNES